MTALIFSLKKYAKDHNVNINTGPVTSSDISISASVTDTTTKLSKSVATSTLNNSMVIPFKNDNDLERSYRGGSGSAQNSLSNLPTARSRSGIKSKDDDQNKLAPEEKIKKTNPIMINQIHRSSNKPPVPNLPKDLVGEIRDQLDETQVR